MTQSAATIKRATQTAPFPFESPILLRAVDLAPYDADDAVMDSWLASLDASEFELILSKLAEADARGSKLEFSA